MTEIGAMLLGIGICSDELYVGVRSSSKFVALVGEGGQRPTERMLGSKAPGVIFGTGLPFPHQNGVYYK